MIDTHAAPSVPLSHLDHLWFQVAGTRCNFTCLHCFISCSPHNDSFGFLSLDQVRRRLVESVGFGVKEYYFTGGEPFLNPQLTDMLIETLRYGPATVLTNASVLRANWLARLADADRDSIYSLEFRVSLDGFTPEQNDPIRGAGTFARTLRGVQLLVQYGFLPIITAARTWPVADEAHVVERFAHMLRQAGYERPRLKILPLLRVGAEVERTHGYDAGERVTSDMLQDYDLEQLVCHHSRAITDRGVHVCPILIESPASLLGQTLAEANRPFALASGACWTCYHYGALCTNPSSALFASPASESGGAAEE